MPYKICLSEDGCWRKDLTTEIPHMGAVKRTFRELVHKYGHNPENLDIQDLSTGRLISHCISLRGRY